jgi:hypothetical protein
VRVARPNNRLQGMRGLACFRAEESLVRRPRTPDPCVVRPLGRHRGSRRGNAPRGCRVTIHRTQTAASRHDLRLSKVATHSDFSELLDFSISGSLEDAVLKFPMFAEWQICALYEIPWHGRMGVWMARLERKNEKSRTRSGVYVNRVAPLEDTSPAQDNAIRFLEDGRFQL